MCIYYCTNVKSLAIAKNLLIIFSVDRHSILDNVGWSVGPSHYEDDLSNHENMHENAVIHDDTSNHDDPDDHDDDSKECKNVLECAKKAY